MPAAPVLSDDLPPTDDRVILNRVYVHRDAAEKLRRVAAVSGYPGVRHQREALRLYLELFNDDGTRR